MTGGKIPIAILASAGILVGGSATPAPHCSALAATQSAKLTDYVQKKFKIPSGTRIELATSSLVGSSCFRQLEFRAKDPKSGFHITLFASPDLTYLSRDLMDTRVDPVQEERRQARDFMAGLARGAFPTLGPKDAPVTVTVFSDFQCPYCAQLARALRTEVLPQETGKIRLVFRHYPLQFHAWARNAAEVTACAADQNNDFFWMLHDFGAWEK